MIIQRGYEYTPTCDGCGAELDAEYGYHEAVSAMKLDGWSIVRPSGMSPQWFHFCPACKDRGKGNG